MFVLGHLYKMPSYQDPSLVKQYSGTAFVVEDLDKHLNLTLSEDLGAELYDIVEFFGDNRNPAVIWDLVKACKDCDNTYYQRSLTKDYYVSQKQLSFLLNQLTLF